LCRVDDPLAQRIHNENAERILLASFVAGLTGSPGRQVRYRNPQTLQQVISVALAVQEAEKQERFNESFYTQFDRSVRLLSRSPSRTGRVDDRPRRPADSHAGSIKHSQKREPSRSAGKPPPSRTTRNAQTEAAVRCYECKDWDIMQENVPLDQNGRAIAQARREGETRAHVLGVRAHLARSPKTRRNGEAPRKRPVRETSERCERWQLPPSQSPCKRCRKVSSLFY